MRETVLRRLCCAVCRGPLRWRSFEWREEGEIEHGVAWCPACRNWYPVEGGLLELLPPPLAYHDDRKHFWEAHRRELLALDLAAGDGEADPDAMEMQRKQQTHFDWYASNDSQTYSSYERMPFWEAVDAGVFDDWREAVWPGGWLLDVGCAQGRSTFKFTDRPLNVVGFDISKALIRQAITSARTAPGRAEFTFFVGDGSRLPFTPESFDYILIYGVLHHLPDPAETCRQVAEVLKPGGVYFGSENNQSVFRGLFDLLMKLNPLWHEEAGAQPLISARQFRRWFAGTPVAIETDTRVFVPPHLVNLLGRRWGAKLLAFSDRVGRRLPLLRGNGGLIMVRGRRGGHTALPPVAPLPIAKSA